MNKLFPAYGVGSLPKLKARVKASRGQTVTEEDIKEVKSLAQRFSVGSDNIIDILKKQRTEKNKLTSEEVITLADFNALLYIKLEESVGLDFVYDGEAKRIEMYQHVARLVLVPSMPIQSTGSSNR